MLVDKVSDYRTQFSKWWISEYKNVQYPEKVLHSCQQSLPNNLYVLSSGHAVCLSPFIDSLGSSVDGIVVLVLNLSF